MSDSEGYEEACQRALLTRLNGCQKIRNRLVAKALETAEVVGRECVDVTFVVELAFI